MGIDIYDLMICGSQKVLLRQIKMPKVKSKKFSSKHTSPAPGGGRKSQKSAEPYHKLICELQKEYKRNGNAQYAVAAKSYMRNQFECYGIKAPQRRAIDKKVFSQYPALDVVATRDVLQKLWKLDEREYQMSAIDLAGRQANVLSGPDVLCCVSSLQVIKDLLTTKSWWDTVDWLASKVIGHFMLEYPEEMEPVLDGWIQDENLWLRRTAIIHQLSYKEKTNKERLFRYCLTCCDEQEFFIQKAIGWALRQYSKVNSKDVKAFLDKNKTKLSKLSVREGSKYV